MSLALVDFGGGPLTSRNADASHKNFITIRGKVATSGTYTAQANGGDKLDFTTLKDILQGVILDFSIGSISGGSDRFLPVSNTNPALWSLIITTASGTELANGAAYPTDTLTFELLLSKFSN